MMLLLESEADDYRWLNNTVCICEGRYDPNSRRSAHRGVHLQQRNLEAAAASPAQPGTPTAPAGHFNRPRPLSGSGSRCRGDARSVRSRQAQAEPSSVSAEAATPRHPPSAYVVGGVSSSIILGWGQGCAELLRNDVQVIEVQFQRTDLVQRTDKRQHLGS